MKKLLILLLLLGLAYYFYHDRFSDNTVVNIAPTVEAKHSSHDFEAVSSLLEQDMNNIPVSLDGDGPKPTHAYDVKHKVHPYLNVHPEYQVLTQVCDVIIGADTERDALRQSTRAEQSRTTFHSSLDQPSPEKHKALPDPAIQQNAIRQRTESTWGAERSRAAVEVQHLLGTLKGKTI